MSDMVFVQHADTGEKREMGTEQFKRVKKKGWKIIPKTKKDDPNTETGNDSGNDNGSGSVQGDAIDVILKDNAKGVVAKIKELAEAKDFATIKTIGERELTMDVPRSTVAVAVKKYESEN